MKLVTSVFVTMLPFLKAFQKDWIPIFVAFSGNGNSVYEAWSNGTNTSLIQADLTYENRSKHLRSPLIDSWGEHDISKIKIELYRQDCMVAWMLFYGKGTTQNDWFNYDRLLDSSFDDKREIKEYNIFGLCAKLYCRYRRLTFSIIKENWLCKDDAPGVFVIMEGRNHCTLEENENNRYPLIMYTKNGTPRNLITDAKKADYMVVYVRI